MLVYKGKNHWQSYTDIVLSIYMSHYVYCMYICICMSVCMFVDVSVYIRVCVKVFAHMYIYKQGLC